jgi:hypothetical protein
MDERTKINFAVSSFEILERQLIDCMEFLPFVEINKQAISPKFIPIIMDSCSLIESIFNEITPSEGKERLNFKKYSIFHEPTLRLEENASLFLVLPVQIIQPYKNWKQRSPIWWDANNKLKHDRLNNYSVATYMNAVNALAGLHQLMSRQRVFIGGFLKAGWIDTHDEDVTIDLVSSAHVGSRVDLIIESKLFASATDSNFVNPETSSEIYLDVDYTAFGLSQHVRNMLFAHEDW